MDLNWLRAVLAIHRVSGAAEGEALKSTVPAGDVTGTPRRPAPWPITGAEVNRCPFWNNNHFLLLPPQNNILWNYLYSDYNIRAALTEGDQLMSSPPFFTHDLMSLWTCGFKNSISLFSPTIKKVLLTDGELLTFTWLFHCKMCLHRRIHIYIYRLLSIERYKGQYNAQHY